MSEDGEQSINDIPLQSDLDDLGDIGDIEMGKRLRQVKEFLGLSTEQLANFMETSSDTVINVEQGKLLIPFEWVYKLTVFFGINANWLLLGAQHMTIEARGAGALL